MNLAINVKLHFDAKVIAWYMFSGIRINGQSNDFPILLRPCLPIAENCTSLKYELHSLVMWTLSHLEWKLDTIVQSLHHCHLKIMKSCLHQKEV